MAKLFNRMLNFVGWEDDEDYIEEEDDVIEEKKEYHTNIFQAGTRKQQNKVVNIHTNTQFKVVIMQPESFEDAQDICDHLKNKKPIIVNLEDIEKESAQRIIDFLSGAVYSLEGNIQKVSTGIFLLAPNNVDIMGDFKDELKNKGVFPWIK
ncbi:MAG: cell division protein SepF [Acetivibrionales bacterium]|jgi:cell division inhibitor SepF